MDKPRRCGCKGCRTCLICEREHGLSVKEFELQKQNSYIYCPDCHKAWPGWNMNDYKQHPNHQGSSLNFPGVYLCNNFLTVEEEYKLIKDIDTMPWTLSQSGRRKQNFGPKCNFKKNKLGEGTFNGFPLFSKFVQEKFDYIPLLKDFQAIEQCFLEYNPERGASIDPHIDDCWIWGERIITVNLLSDSVLTMTFNKNISRYNLHYVNTYPAVLNEEGTLNQSKNSYPLKLYNSELIYPIVRIPMPKRSLLILFNSARYDWEHQILREDVRHRRVCIAYREFTPLYLQGGLKYEESKKILLRAKQYL